MHLTSSLRSYYILLSSSLTLSEPVWLKVTFPQKVMDISGLRNFGGEKIDRSETSQLKELKYLAMLKSTLQ
jgi:hypothetical protein